MFEKIILLKSNDWLLALIVHLLCTGQPVRVLRQYEPSTGNDV